ncbi:MAG: cupin domain-containing protein [Actinomycetota bacterium]
MGFICQDDVEWEELDWGSLGWAIRPASVPDAAELCCLDVRLEPGKGHDFHNHPNQEELIFVRSGVIEQWIGTERRDLTPGDIAYIPKGVVHATFVDADAAEGARLLVVLGPSYGPDGYEAVDKTAEEPWSTLR